jgi:hypothetical protein
VELSVVVIGKKLTAGLEPLNDLIAAFGIQIVPFDAPMAGHSQFGCASYGKATTPPA